MLKGRIIASQKMTMMKGHKEEAAEASEATVDSEAVVAMMTVAEEEAEEVEAAEGTREEGFIIKGIRP